MPTLKPRISITLDPESIAVLDRFASLAKQPRASFISAMITAAVPEFARAADVMELALDAPKGVQRYMVQNMSNATVDAMGFLDNVINETRDVVRHARNRSKEMEARENRSEGPRLRGVERSRSGRVNPAKDPRPLTGGSNC